VLIAMASSIATSTAPARPAAASAAGRRRRSALLSNRGIWIAASLSLGAGLVLFFAVVAPVNAAFAGLPADQANALLADVPRLTAVLTHHVVQGRLGPDRLAGEHIALDNGTVTVTGSGEKFTVAADQTLSGKPATVVCGNVQTANATVYFVDQLLKPKTG
jgi:hypothetical protein